jgi:hypothetical protein
MGQVWNLLVINLGTQLAEIKGEIEEIWKFNGQLGVKLKNLKPRTKMKRRWNLVLKLKFVKGKIEQNSKFLS